MKLEKLTKKQTLKLLAVLILSEGYINYSGSSPYIALRTLASSLGQHKLFRDFCVRLAGKEPRRYRYKDGQGYSKRKELLSSEMSNVNLVKELERLTPTFNTTSRKMKPEKFLRKKKPTMKFLLLEPKNVRELALRIWLDFDGAVCPFCKLKRKIDKKGGKEYKYFQVQFECDMYLAETNPHLIQDLKKICESVGLRAKVVKDKRKWSKIGGLRISELKSVKKLLKLGPMTDIVISSKSNRFSGIRKLDVCRAVEDLLEGDFPLSTYFKRKEEAIRFRKDLNRILEDKVRECSNSPVV